MRNLYDTTIRYLARVFTHALPVSFTMKDAVKLAEALGRDDLQQQAGVTASTPAGKEEPVLALMGSSDGLLIAAHSGGIQVQRGDVVAGRTLDFDEFVNDAFGNYLPKMLSFFQRRGHRLALVREGFLQEIDKEKAVSRLVQMPSFFQEHPPFEWDWRCASRLDVDLCGDEKLNAVATVKRMQGHWKNPPESFDRLRLDLDVNTSPDNTDSRFGPDACQKFSKLGAQQQAILAKSVASFLEIES